MSVAWSIKDWNEVFEDHRSREVTRLHYLPCRVLDRKSDAYATLVTMDGGVEAYGVFWALVLIAARCPVRGVLSDDRGPMTAIRLAVKSRLPVNSVERALGLLSMPEVGWLQQVSSTHEVPTDCRRGADAPPTACRPNADRNVKTDDDLSQTADEVPTKPPLGAERARNSTQQHTTATATATGGDEQRGAAAAAVELSAEEIAGRAAYLQARPAWLGEAKRWLSPGAVREFAADPRVSQAVVDEAYAEGKAARTLDNPAGVVIKRIRAAIAVGAK